MTKKLLVVSLIFVSAVALSACKKQATTSSSTNQLTQASPAGEEVMEKSGVTIQNFAFSPNKITVKAGQTITIANKDLAGHSFTSDDGKSFDTNIIAQNQTVTVTAPTQVGNYAFHCTPHPNMTGTLVVE